MILDRGSSDSGIDLVRACASEPGLGSSLVIAPADELVHEFAKRQRIELKRFGFQANGAPAQRVTPDEAERITQKALKGCRRLSPAECGQDRRMAGRDQAIVGASAVGFPLPMSPAKLALPDVLELPGVARPGQQPVCLTERVSGMRSRLWMISSTGHSELGERMPPFALRSGRDRTKISRVPHRG